MVGGGNSAVSEALLLSRLCRHVTLVHRRSTFRASAAELAALEKQDNVTFCRNSIVTELLGRERLTGIRLQLTEEGCGEYDALDANSTQRLRKALLLMPWGVQAMSMDVPGLVETSLNLGVARWTSRKPFCASPCAARCPRRRSC